MQIWDISGLGIKKDNVLTNAIYKNRTSKSNMDAYYTGYAQLWGDIWATER